MTFLLRVWGSFILRSRHEESSCRIIVLIRCQPLFKGRIEILRKSINDRRHEVVKRLITTASQLATLC